MRQLLFLYAADVKFQNGVYGIQAGRLNRTAPTDLFFSIGFRRALWDGPYRLNFFCWIQAGRLLGVPYGFIFFC